MPKKSTKRPNADLENDELLALARHDIERGELESALSKLKQILASDDVPTEAPSITARLYAQLGLFERAQALFQQYIDANPTSLVERFQLGMTYLDAGHPQEALEIWEAVLNEQPIHPPALFYKGLVLAQSGKIADAKQCLETLMHSAPADNLYFGRAKELLQAIETGGKPASVAAEGAKQANTLLPKDAYKTEH